MNTYKAWWSEQGIVKHAALSARSMKDAIKAFRSMMRYRGVKEDKLHGVQQVTKTQGSKKCHATNH